MAGADLVRWLTPLEVALAWGFSPSTVRKWFNGEGRPRFDPGAIYKISERKRRLLVDKLDRTRIEPDVMERITYFLTQPPLGRSWPGHRSDSRATTAAGRTLTQASRTRDADRVEPGQGEAPWHHSQATRPGRFGTRRSIRRQHQRRSRRDHLGDRLSVRLLLDPTGRCIGRPRCRVRAGPIRGCVATAVRGSRARAGGVRDLRPVQWRR